MKSVISLSSQVAGKLAIRNLHGAVMCHNATQSEQAIVLKTVDTSQETGNFYKMDTFLRIYMTNAFGKCYFIGISLPLDQDPF